MTKIVNIKKIKNKILGALRALIFLRTGSFLGFVNCSLEIREKIKIKSQIFVFWRIKVRVGGKGGYERKGMNIQGKRFKAGSKYTSVVSQFNKVGRGI